MEPRTAFGSPGSSAGAVIRLAAMTLNADRPIATRDEDLLERGPLVEQLVGWIRNAPSDDGIVIGVTGPWGSGKTSVLRLLAEDLKDQAAVIWFEPWLFTHTDELVSRFFEELAGQLTRGRRRRLKRLGKAVADYGHAVSPAVTVVGDPLGRLLELPKTFADQRRGTAMEQRQRLRTALSQHDQQIVVLIDDIDRLDPEEVREVLRLVKLVADLPNVVHVLSYDRRRVERALDGSGDETGRAFLEKIIQASARVPPLSKDRVRRMSLEWLQRAVGDRPLQSWDDREWSLLVGGGIDGYLHTLRDGRRFANAAPAALDLCGDEVASMDVLALEALRVFDPDVHEALPQISSILVGGRLEEIDFRSSKEVSAEKRRRLDEVLNCSSHASAARVVLRHLFPPAAEHLGDSGRGHNPKWRAAKRVASAPVLDRYLHMVLADDEVPAAVVDGTLAALVDAERFRAVLDDVDDERLDDLINRTRTRLDEASAIDTVGCALVALTEVPRLPRRHGFFDVEPLLRMLWFVGDLVGHAAPDRRVAIAQELVNSAPTARMRLELFYRFSANDEPSEERELDILDGADRGAVAAALARDIQTMAPAQLADEAEGLWLIEFLAKVEGREAALRLLQNPRVLASVTARLGTRFRPTTGRGASFDIAALVEIAGPDVVGLLKEVTDSGLVDADVREELRSALDQYRKRSALDRDVAGEA